MRLGAGGCAARAHSKAASTSGDTGVSIQCDQAHDGLDDWIRQRHGHNVRHRTNHVQRVHRQPVVVVSAHHQAPEIAARMQVAGCVPKPVDFEALTAFVKTRCGE